MTDKMCIIREMSYKTRNELQKKTTMTDISHEYLDIYYAKYIIYFSLYSNAI